MKTVPNKICVECGKEYTPHHYHGGIQKYCSIQCKRKNKYRARAKPPLPLRKCDFCGSDFRPRHDRHRFCLPKCNWGYQNKTRNGRMIEREFIAMGSLLASAAVALSFLPELKVVCEWYKREAANRRKKAGTPTVAESAPEKPANVAGTQGGEENPLD